jgi:hypothetical protein
MVKKDLNFPLTDTFLFSLTEVKSLPSGKRTYQLILNTEMTESDYLITGGFHAPNTMPLR